MTAVKIHDVEADDRRIEGWLSIYREAVDTHETEAAVEAAAELDRLLRAPVWPS